MTRDERNREMVDKAWTAVKAKDLDALDRLLHDDFQQRICLS